MMVLAKMTPRDRKVALMGCSALLVATTMATGAFAQDAVEEIVVTAQKRAQNQQQVPVAVSALTSEVLQANRITNLMDVGSVAPGVTVRNAAGGVSLPVITMRGELSSGGTAGQDKSVSINVDGVYIGSIFGSSYDIPDLQQVEILRGPQGTLFGRNSTAGAINFTTADPTGKWGARQEITVGNYDQFRTLTHVDFPAVGPFSAYITYVHDERTGDIKNTSAGTVWDRTNSTRQGIQVSPKTLGDKDANSVHAAVKFAPGDVFDTTYKFDWTENHYTPEGNGLIAFTPVEAGFGGFGTALVAAYDPTTNPVNGTHRPDSVNNDWTTPGYLRAFGHTLTSNLHITDELSVKNIFAYRNSYVYANTGYLGLAGINFFGTTLYPPNTSTANVSEQLSDELQAVYDSHYLTLTGGALYFNQYTETGTPDGLAAPGFFAAYPGNKLPPGRDLTFIRANSKAAYFQAEAHVTPKFDIFAGYRYTWDHKPGYTYIAGTRSNFSYDKSTPTYLAGANYKLTNDLMVYGKFSTGFISGGSVAGVDFNQESVKSWEAGLKSDWLDRRLRVNLALFSAKYKHIQQGVPGSLLQPPRPDLVIAIADFGNADAKGGELEITALPVRGLTLAGSVSYTYFKYTTYNPAVVGAFGVYPVWLRPTWTANMSATYESKPVFGEARVMARVDASWRSKLTTPGVFFPLTSPLYQPIVRTGNDWIVNGRLALKDIALGAGVDGEIALWARNLLDNDKPVWGNYSFYVGATTYNPARTFGVDFIMTY